MKFFAGLLFYEKNKRTNFKKISILELSFLTNILFFIRGYEFLIIANAIVLAIGISEINRENKLNHLGILNFGLILINILITCRFFDTNLSFIIRGLLFIIIGLGFFLINFIMLKKK